MCQQEGSQGLRISGSPPHADLQETLQTLVTTRVHPQSQAEQGSQVLRDAPLGADETLPRPRPIAISRVVIVPVETEHGAVGL